MSISPKTPTAESLDRQIRSSQISRTIESSRGGIRMPSSQAASFSSRFNPLINRCIQIMTHRKFAAGFIFQETVRPDECMMGCRKERTRGETHGKRKRKETRKMHTQKKQNKETLTKGTHTRKRHTNKHRKKQTSDTRAEKHTKPAPTSKNAKCTRTETQKK